jgi:ASC-1-like (ASCH) protein
MDHIAIMRKEWGLIPKILSGEKTIESRWYLSRKNPWNRIKRGDTVYFKNTSGPIVAKASVRKVKEFDSLQPQKVRDILKKYDKGGQIGLNNVQKNSEFIQNKKFCILIFLKNPKKIRPFRIDKSGFGISSAWFCTNDIRKIKT